MAKSKSSKVGNKSQTRLIKILTEALQIAKIKDRKIHAKQVASRR